MAECQYRLVAIGAPYMGPANNERQDAFAQLVQKSLGPRTCRYEEVPIPGSPSLVEPHVSIVYHITDAQPFWKDHEAAITTLDLVLSKYGVTLLRGVVSKIINDGVRGAIAGAGAGFLAAHAVNSAQDNEAGEGDAIVASHALLMLLGGFVGGVVGKLIERDAEVLGIVTKDSVTRLWTWQPATLSTEAKPQVALDYHSSV